MAQPLSKEWMQEISQTDEFKLMQAAVDKADEIVSSDTTEEDRDRLMTEFIGMYGGFDACELMGLRRAVVAMQEMEKTGKAPQSFQEMLTPLAAGWMDGYLCGRITERMERADA
jgi:hypothetical protein